MAQCFCLLLTSIVILVLVTVNSVNGFPRIVEQRQQQRKLPITRPSTHPSALHSPTQLKNNFDGEDSSSSLSIVNPIDVLRSQMQLEIHRTKLRQAKNQLVAANREYISKVGR